MRSAQRRHVDLRIVQRHSSFDPSAERTGRRTNQQQQNNIDMRQQRRFASTFLSPPQRTHLGGIRARRRARRQHCTADSHQRIHHAKRGTRIANSQKHAGNEWTCHIEHVHYQHFQVIGSGNQIIRHVSESDRIVDKAHVILAVWNGFQHNRKRFRRAFRRTFRRAFHHDFRRSRHPHFRR